jgi:hypothetical protein
MRKLITLLAAAAIVASPFAFADTTGNTNDPLQQAQTTGNQTLADADNASQPAAGSDMSSSDTSKTTTMTKKHTTKHHKKHCTKHCKAKHKKKVAPAADAAPADASAPSTDMSH